MGKNTDPHDEKSDLSKGSDGENVLKSS